MYDVGPIFDHLDEIEKYLEQARLELAAGQTINAIMAIQGIAQNTAVAQTRALGNLCRIMVDQGLGS